MIEYISEKERLEQNKRYLYSKLYAEGLGVRATNDRWELAQEAKAEAAERKRISERRRRPSYAAIEARQPLDPAARIIRPEEIRDVAAESATPAPRPNFEQMRAQAKDFPPIPAEVHEYNRRKRIAQRKKSAEQDERNGRATRSRA